MLYFLFTLLLKYLRLSSTNYWLYFIGKLGIIQYFLLVNRRQFNIGIKILFFLLLWNNLYLVFAL